VGVTTCSDVGRLVEARIEPAASTRFAAGKAAAALGLAGPWKGRYYGSWSDKEYSMRRRLISAAIVLIACSLLTGCGKFKKTKECNAFIDKVNTAIKEIEKHSASKGGEDAQVIADMKKLADLYDATNYQGMCVKAASTARQVASAIETKNSEQTDTAQKEFDKIVKQEDDLVSQINTFCQAP
jgi:hypothetical protein